MVASKHQVAGRKASSWDLSAIGTPRPSFWTIGASSFGPHACCSSPSHQECRQTTPFSLHLTCVRASDGGSRFGKVGIFPELHLPLFSTVQALGIRNAGTVIEPAVRKALAKYRNVDFVEKENRKADCFMNKLMKLEEEGKVNLENQMDCIGGNLAAGTDTTGITISACLYYLYHNPHILQKLRDEIDGATQEGTASDPIPRRESRLPPMCHSRNSPHPPCSRLHLAARSPSRGHGTRRNILPSRHPRRRLRLGPKLQPRRLRSRRPRLQLRPYMDQFGSAKNAAAQMGNSFSFGGGSRTCIGKNVSLLEMTKVVPQIVRKFEFVFADEGREWKVWSSWFVFQEYWCYVKEREV